MTARASYIDILNEYYPDISVSTAGGSYDYDALQLNDSSQTLPSKEDLDEKALLSLREKIWEDIKTYRDIRKFSGTRVGDNWFHSDDSSRIQQIALMILGAGMPPGIMWKTMSGTFVPMTQTLARQIFQATVGNDSLDYAAAEQHRAAMVASENPETYDFKSTKWLQRFDEYMAAQPPAA